MYLGLQGILVRLIYPFSCRVSVTVHGWTFHVLSLIPNFRRIPPSLPRMVTTPSGSLSFPPGLHTTAYSNVIRSVWLSISVSAMGYA